MDAILAGGGRKGILYDLDCLECVYDAHWEASELHTREIHSTGYEDATLNACNISKMRISSTDMSRTNTAYISRFLYAKDPALLVCRLCAQ